MLLLPEDDFPFLEEEGPLRPEEEGPFTQKMKILLFWAQKRIFLFWQKLIFYQKRLLKEE